MRPLIIRKLKSFGSLEITGRRAVDGLFDITFHYFSHCSRRNGIVQTSVTRYYLGYRSDPVMRRYIGISSVYRR